MECAGKADLAALRGGIQSSLNDGVDLVNYVGHGAIDRFGNAGYLTSTDVPALRNGSRLPVVVAVTCVAGQFSVPGSTCLAQSLLLQSQGGAVAVIAPTGLSINKDASRLNLRLMSLLPGNPQAALGDLFRQAMTDHITLDKPLTEPAIYNLIGDPATTYNVALSGVAAPAPTFTGAVASQGSLVLTWSGGRPPYQLEIKSSLRPDALWQALGEPVENPSATVSLGGQLGFLRVRCNP